MDNVYNKASLHDDQFQIFVDTLNFGTITLDVKASEKQNTTNNKTR